MSHLTTNMGKGWAPDLVAVAPEDAIPEALILQTSSVMGRVEGDEPQVRCLYVDDAAAANVAEGASITPTDHTDGEALVSTTKVAHLFQASYEQMVQPNAADLLTNASKRAVTKKANANYVTALLGTVGIVAGANIDGSLDALVDGIATVEANDGEVSHLLVDPVGWAAVSKLKQATGSNMPILGAGNDDTERRLLSRPVIVTNAMPANTLLAVDKFSVVSAVGDVRLAISEHAAFAADSVMVRVTFRSGATLVRANRAAKFAIGPAA